MQILTYPVGVVVGILPIVVELGVPPKPASLDLDGRRACALTAEAPGCTVEFGSRPRVHLLELVRRDASGRVVERATRWVNRPGSDQAEVQTQTTCAPGGATCTVLVGWAHPDRLNPSRIRVAVDGKAVRLPKDRTLAVPARAVRGTLLTVELAFPDDRRATYAGAVGGRTHGDESVDLVPMLHEGTCDAARLAEVVRRYRGAKVGVRAVEPGEPGDWQLTFVAEPAVATTFRSFFEERRKPLLGPKRLLVPDRLAGVFGGPGNVVALTGVAASETLPEFDLLQGGSPEFWVERLVAALRAEGAAGCARPMPSRRQAFTPGPRRGGVPSSSFSGATRPIRAVFPLQASVATSKKSACPSKRGTWRQTTGRTGPERGVSKRRGISTTRCSPCDAASRASPSPGWKPTSGPRRRRRVRPTPRSCVCPRIPSRGSAGEEGFEPPVPFGTAVFKTAALNHSATPPEERAGGHYLLTLLDFAARRTPADRWVSGLNQRFAKPP